MQAEDNPSQPKIVSGSESQSPIQPPSASIIREKVIQPLSTSPNGAAPTLLSNSAGLQSQLQNPPNVSPNLSANQPVIYSSGNIAPSPAAMYGHDDSYKVAGPRHMRWGVIIGGIAAFLLLLAVATYLWILPSIWSNSYIKNIKPLYQQQASQITAVYQSISRPVFTGSDSSAASDTQDFQYISGVIETAIKNTDALKSKDHLIVLPGTKSQHSVSAANTEYQAMQQYVSDSQAFLQDYKTLVIYTEQVEQVAEVQLPKLINDTNIINSGTSSESAFITDLQTTTADLQSFISQMKGQKAPADLNGFNQSLLTDLDGMNSALSAQASDLQNNNGSDFVTQLAVYVSAYKDFVGLLNSNPTANIQTNSIIHSQITTLEAEHPFQ